MHRLAHQALVVAALALLLPSVAARAADAPGADMPKPPSTTLPAFENPLHDAQPGESLRYKVRQIDTDEGWVRYFEERVLARSGEGEKVEVLIETVETDAAGEKVFSVDNQRTGWVPAGPKLPMPKAAVWLEDKTKDEVLYVGSPPTAAVRCVRRHRQMPVNPTKPEGEKEVTQLWYSHDVPVTGVVKRFPAQGGGERYAIAWDKRLPAETCTERAKRYPKQEAPSSPTSGTTPTPEPGMDEPGMGEPGMDEPGMGEPGMDEPAMGEPGMEEPGMDEPGRTDGGRAGGA
jgi:hypothetical protein